MHPFSIQSPAERFDLGLRVFYRYTPQPNYELVKVETAVSVLGSSIPISDHEKRYQLPTSEKFQLLINFSPWQDLVVWNKLLANPDLIYPLCSRYETLCDWMIARISQVMLIIRLGHIVRPYSWNKLQSYFLNTDRISR